MEKLIFVLIFCQLFIFLTDCCSQGIIADSTDQNITEDKWLGKDKFKHFVACLYYAGFTEWISNHHYGLYKNQSRRTGVIVSISIGIVKEMYDKKRYNKFSWKDIVFDILGAVCGALLINK